MPQYWIATIVLALAITAFSAPPVLTTTIIDHVNAQRPGWRAAMNPRFSNLTMDQARSLLGLSEEPLLESERPVARAEQSVSFVTLPAEFDALRDKWPNCKPAIRDQQGCGGCWAFASTSVFSIRMCIATNGTTNIPMAPQYPISCDTGNAGCGGGTLSGPWRFFASNGVVAETDYPFTSGNGNSGTCSLKPTATKYYSSSYKQFTTVAAMQTEIYQNGPIQVGFAVYNDFFSYRSGVYSYTSGAYAGGHSVYLTGWGVDGYGTPYWIAVNSWGSSWGLNGMFWIKRGVNMCNIESGYIPVARTVVVPTAAPTTAASTTTKAPTPAPTTTTKAPTTTTTTAAPISCWTCSAGYVHWYDIPGMAQPADQCACVPIPTTTKAPTSAPTTTTTSAPTTTKAPTPAPTTTKAPTTTTAAPTTTTSTPTYNCWTCSAGYVHWYDIPGMAQPADRCACVPIPTTTNAPTSAPTTTTTRAPTTTPKPTPSPPPITTTRAPLTTIPIVSTSAAPTNNCWTCPSGQVHWYDIQGMAEPADKCACVPDPNIHNCWTCSAGYVHWYEVPGMAQPADQCACVPIANTALTSAASSQAI